MLCIFGFHFLDEESFISYKHNAICSGYNYNKFTTSIKLPELDSKVKEFNNNQ